MILGIEMMALSVGSLLFAIFKCRLHQMHGLAFFVLSYVEAIVVGAAFGGSMIHLFLVLHNRSGSFGLGGLGFLCVLLTLKTLFFGYEWTLQRWLQLVINLLLGCQLSLFFFGIENLILLLLPIHVLALILGLYSVIRATRFKVQSFHNSRFVYVYQRALFPEKIMENGPCSDCCYLTPSCFESSSPLLADSSRALRYLYFDPPDYHVTAVPCLPLAVSFANCVCSSTAGMPENGSLAHRQQARELQQAYCSSVMFRRLSVFAMVVACGWFMLSVCSLLLSLYLQTVSHTSVPHSAEDIQVPPTSYGLWVGSLTLLCITLMLLTPYCIGLIGDYYECKKSHMLAVANCRICVF
eukprot:GHVQ01015655.1.p1 GENE.GHVQ01015655.1~~GHVQ01015655.1.p1  ORF type:complete len:353 (+),score=21.38 GHVQ01015655.1:354-1412(+)